MTSMILFNRMGVIFMRKILIKSIIQAIPAVIIGGIMSIISLYTQIEFLRVWDFFCKFILSMIKKF